MIEHIPDLIDAGIDSYKIEGRMKTALYVATVARTYRLSLIHICTRAAVMPDQIDEQVKAARSEKLIALGHDMSCLLYTSRCV